MGSTGLIVNILRVVRKGRKELIHLLFSAANRLKFAYHMTH